MPEKLNQVIDLLIGINLVAQAAVILTPTPKDDELYRKVYRKVEILAGLVGYAKPKR